MASKRKVRTEAQKEEVEELDDSDLPQWVQEQSWGEWFKSVYASRIYALACFAFDVFLALELYAVLDSGIAWVVLPVLALCLALQVTIYLYLWGSSGRLRS
jgi:hypothetical protein